MCFVMENLSLLGDLTNTSYVTKLSVLFLDKNNLIQTYQSESMRTEIQIIHRNSLRFQKKIKGIGRNQQR